MGYPMAKNLRAGLSPEKTLLICDVPARDSGWKAVRGSIFPRGDMFGRFGFDDDRAAANSFLFFIANTYSRTSRRPFLRAQEIKAIRVYRNAEELKRVSRGYDWTPIRLGAEIGEFI
jgi:hypothetical protein